MPQRGAVSVRTLAIVVAAVAAVGAALWYGGVVGPGAVGGASRDGSVPETATLEGGDAAASPGAPARLAPGTAVASSGEVSVRLLAFRDRAPIAGQPVRLVSPTGTRLERSTGGDGRVLFTGVAPNPDWTLSVEPPGLAAVEVRGIEVRAGTRKELDDLLIGEQVVLRGRVIDGRGQPVPGASVAVYGSTPPDLSRGLVSALLAAALELPTPASEAKTDERGDFALASVPPGTYRLATRSAGFALDVKPDLVVAADRPPAAVTIVLGPAAIARGKVVDENGAPVAGARVLAIEDAGARWRGPSSFKKDWTVTGADGRYVLDTLSRGASYRFGVTATGRAPLFDAVATEVDLELVRDFTLPRGGAVEGKVIDAKTNAPVSGASVLVLTGSFPMGGRGGRGGGAPGADATTTTGTATSAADGTFRVDGLKPGPVAIGQVRAAGYSEYSASTFSGTPWGDVKAGETLSVEARLEPGATVKGRVTTTGTSGPVPVAGAQVAVLSFSSVFNGYPTATTDVDGAYRVDGVRVGTPVGVTASAPGLVGPNPFAREAQITIAEGESEVVRDLVMSAAGSVEGRVTNAKGAPVAGARLRTRPAPAPGRGGFGGGGWRGLLGGGGTSVALTDADGAYRLEHVAADERVVVEAESDEHVPTESEPIEVRAGEVKKVDLVLLGGATIRGRVVDDGGHVVAGATVRIGKIDDETDKVTELSGWRADQLLESRSFASGDDGFYEIPRVRPGRVLVKVEKAGYTTLYRRDLLARPDDVLENVGLSLLRGETVSGTVRGDDGKPIANAIVAVTKQANPTFRGGGAPPPGTPPPTEEPSVEPTMSDRTDDQGRFTVEGVPPHATYSVVVWFAPGYRGWAQSSEGAIRRGVGPGTHDVELVLQKAEPGETGFPMPPGPRPAGSSPRPAPPPPAPPAMGAGR